MISSMKERYEQLKKYPNTSLNYDEILLFYPDYYKLKVKLEKEEFIPEEEVDERFNENYKNSDFYKELVKLKMAEDDIDMYMGFNKDIKYLNLKRIFDEYVNYSIRLCDLIDYIGHYPSTNAELKEEVNKEMDELIKNYNILVSCSVDDDFETKIIAGDVVRIIDTLTENINMIKLIKNRANENDWLFTKQTEEEKNMDVVIENINKFPESNYQSEEEKLQLKNKM